MIKVGDIYLTNNCGDVEVVGYVNYSNVKVRFVKTGYITTTEAGSLRKGEVKDKLLPSVYEVGFVGEGDRVPSIKGKHTKEYSIWKDMLRRCYHPKDKGYVRYGGRNIKVCKEWHNFQNFAKWCNEQPNFGKDGFHLDKDLKVTGSKIYSPNTCSFIPIKVNSLLTTSNSKRGAFPAGVHNQAGKFISQCNDGTDIQQYLGSFPTPEAAFAVYKLYKEKIIKKVANDEYNKGNICKDVYLNLMECEVVPYPD